MNIYETGGPALQIPLTDPQGEAWPLSKGNPDGMTLRDYFAAKVLSGFIASHSGPDATTPEPKWAAAQSYEYADAMLKERDK